MPVSLNIFENPGREMERLKEGKMKTRAVTYRIFKTSIKLPMEALLPWDNCSMQANHMKAEVCATA